MTYEQKFAALKALCSSTALHMRNPGDWTVLMSGIGRIEGNCSSVSCTSGATPEAAVDAKWAWVTDPKYYLVINAMRDTRRAVRWNGFIWEDVDEKH